MALIVVAFFGKRLLLSGTSDVGGDFLALYSAARIASSEHPEQLYDRATQERVQAELTGSQGELLYFAYPPFVAILLSPLTLLSLEHASLVMVGLSLLALWYSICLLKRQGYLGHHSLSEQELFVLAVAFYPLMRSILGGQNTTLSLLCLVSALYWLSKRQETFAGLCLATWLFKPHLALVVTTWGVLSGRTGLLKGFLPGTLLLYLLSAVVFGLSWPLWWIQSIDKSFFPAEFAFNGKNQISLLGVLEQLFDYRSAIALGLWIFGALLLWWRNAQILRSRSLDEPAVGAELSLLLVLIAPHVMWYDIGIVLPALYFIYSQKASISLLLLFLSWGASILPSTTISPYFWLLVGVQVAVFFCSTSRAFQR